MPSYHADALVAQAQWLMRGRLPTETYTDHDLYFIGKKPIDTPLGPAYTSDTVRDISVGTWQMRSLGEELVQICC